MLSGSMSKRAGLVSVGWAALCIAACTDTHQMNGTMGPRSSTETGNPPAIDSALVALVVTRDEVHVVGEPGAVTPGGIVVEVETVATGDTQRGPVTDDGAFDVQVDGSLDDLYALRAIGEGDGGAPRISSTVYVYRGRATVGAGDAGTLSCEDRAAVIRGQLAAIEDRTGDACESNSDCVAMPPPPANCPAWVCGGPAASYAGAAEVKDEVASIASALC